MRNLIFIASLLTVLISGSAMAQEVDSIKLRPAQLTFITPLGTNGLQSTEIANGLSINMIGGYNGGVQGFEVGGFINMTKYYVEGVQVGGFANINNGHLEGVQVGGFGNINMKRMDGVQVAGYANYAGDSVEGIQVGGFANMALKRTKGMQVSGFANMVIGNMDGAQIAGFANVATDTLNGFQASGFVNIAETVKGVQVGFINIADTVDGASIGFLSLVKNGYHALEINANEATFINASLKLGTQKFYNVFSIGMQPATVFRWAAGYGIGTFIPISEKWSSNFDLMAYHINEDRLWTTKLNEFYQLKANANFKITNGITLTAGPTFNMMISDYLGVDPQNPGSEFPPYHQYNYTTNSDYNIKMWVGLNAGIRF